MSRSPDLFWEDQLTFCEKIIWPSLRRQPDFLYEKITCSSMKKPPALLWEEHLFFYEKTNNIITPPTLLWQDHLLSYLERPLAFLWVEILYKKTKSYFMRWPPTRFLFYEKSTCYLLRKYGMSTSKKISRLFYVKNTTSSFVKTTGSSKGETFHTSIAALARSLPWLPGLFY